MSHYFMGGVSIFIPHMTPGFFFYQFAQYFCNRRVFMLHGRIEEGNNLEHTMKKIGQYFTGAWIGMIVFGLITDLELKK